MVEVMKIMVTFLKRSYACTVTLSAPYPAAGQHQPTSRDSQTPTVMFGTVSCEVTALSNSVKL